MSVVPETLISVLSSFHWIILTLFYTHKQFVISIQQSTFSKLHATETQIHFL